MGGGLAGGPWSLGTAIVPLLVVVVRDKNLPLPAVQDTSVLILVVGSQLLLQPRLLEQKVIASGQRFMKKRIN